MNEKDLEEWLSRPTAGAIQALESLEGDLLILGAGGKMGPTLARMARRAMPTNRNVIAASRFSSASARETLQSHGVQTIACDLLDRTQVDALPDVPNVIFMAGQKFGTSDAPELTWMINAVLPSLVAQRFSASRMVVFSTGCVYALSESASGGSLECDALSPPGEYAFSCVARERVFTHYSRTLGIPLVLFRLNYAIDLRYGVLFDIASKVYHAQPVDVTPGYVNVIWQGDANARALQSLAHTSCPPTPLNITGREMLSVRELASRFGRAFQRDPILIGNEAPRAWLSNATRSYELFGDVSVSIDEMIDATANWIRGGGRSLGKPTHFESTDGKF